MGLNPASRKPLYKRRMQVRMAMIHLRRVARAKRRLEAAYRERDDAIIEAYVSGETQRDIARYAGISHQRVQQILAEARRRPPPTV